MAQQTITFVSQCFHRVVEERVPGHGTRLVCPDCGVKSFYVFLPNKLVPAFDKVVKKCAKFELANSQPAPYEMRIGAR